MNYKITSCVPSALTSKKHILLFLLVFTYFISRFFSLSKYPIYWIDEAWWMNPAYNFLEYGKLGISMLKGWHNIENKLFWTPPLYIIFFIMFI